MSDCRGKSNPVFDQKTSGMLYTNFFGQGTMRTLIQNNLKSIGFYATFLSIISFGIYLRLNQIAVQVLLDDEWHVIHQLLDKTPVELLLTFGLADFSIPLSLLFWTEIELFGLSEMSMRWPMVIGGIASLIIIPLYVRKYFDDKVILVFSVLLAISPMLVWYSRTARPYALTLLFSFLAVVAIHKYIEADRSFWKPGLVYAVFAILSAWLHLISLPIVLAPFLALGFPALVNRNWGQVRRLCWLGLITLVGLLAVLLPPMLGNPEALSVKLGAAIPELQTYYGVLFFWLGTSSTSVVLVGGILATIGVRPLFRTLPIAPSLLTGLIMTLCVIIMTQPAWVHYPLTLARYLLPAILLLLLSVSLGISQISAAISHRLGRFGGLSSVVTTLPVLLLMCYYSPLSGILANPNSNSLHSVFRFDFRPEKNLISLYQSDFPVSPFWYQLAALPRDTLKIAASPFSFESHHWDAARWEQISHQRVMPGYLVGFCADHRWGEVPNNRSYKFKNVGYLSDQSDLVKRGFDLVAYQKPYKVMTNQGEKEFGIDTANCESKLREQFPTPIYEDRWLLVFPLSNNIRNTIESGLKMK
ncbi:MAG: glycosyltransferase family 39 protein [Porticoccus sp.]|nr:glycosyltransferase family 39 protein [Porticoccus sp.]